MRNGSRTCVGSNDFFDPGIVYELFPSGHMTDKMDVLKEYSSENNDNNNSNGNNKDVVIENTYPIEALKNESANGTSNGVANGQNGHTNGHTNGYTNGHC